MDQTVVQHACFPVLRSRNITCCTSDHCLAQFVVYIELELLVIQILGGTVLGLIRRPRLQFFYILSNFEYF